MYQGGSSRKQGPRLAMCDADEELPRDAPVRPCEWPHQSFVQAKTTFVRVASTSCPPSN